MLVVFYPITIILDPNNPFTDFCLILLDFEGGFLYVKVRLNDSFYPCGFHIPETGFRFHGLDVMRPT